MSDEKPTLESMPEISSIALKRLEEKRSVSLDELILSPGTKESLRTKGIARLNNNTYLAADISADGKVLAVAAAVSRTPVKAEKYLRDSVPDFKATGGLTRRDRIALYHQIFLKEGIINNALKKKASLISQDGGFRIRYVKQGKRSKTAVKDELLTLLTFWAENVNAAADDMAVTGSRGIKQVIRRGARQAMIEGDLFLRQVWNTKVEVPLLSKKYSLPMNLQALSSADVEIAEDLVGFGGIQLYYWIPSQEKINAILRPKDPNVKKIMDKLIKPEVRNQLKKSGKFLLDPSLLVHIKHAGNDTDPYGQSDVEAAVTDLAYVRALKSLDFVTIDSLINRMLVIKIGDANPDSAYHALATAQARVNVFNRLLTEVGPNMLVIWAGHDIDSKDIGAHSQLLDTKSRHELGIQGTKMSTGVPDPLLTGNAEGGNAVAWAGFVSLGAVTAELQEEWTQTLTQLGRRIAMENGYEDVDLVWEFSHRLLADREANAKIAIQAFDRGLLSRKSVLEEIGKTYEVEKEQRIQENEDEDNDIFMPPLNLRGGPSGNQGVDPEDQPGRPTNKDNPEKTGPERDREDKTTTP